MSIKLPVITTDRLILRSLAKKDARAVFAYAKLPHVGPNAGWVPLKTLEEAHQFIRYSLQKQKNGQPGVWAIVLAASRTVIGVIELHSYRKHKAEIGFALHPAYWNQGIITEATKAVMVYAFEVLKLQRLAYAHFLDNSTSRRVAEKCGFSFEGVKRKGFMHGDGRVLDEAILSYTDDDYEKNRQTIFEPFKAKLTIK